MRHFAWILPVFLLAITFFSCKKDKFITDPAAKLEFSTDSILFDTVFTTIGSTTKRFRVYNPNDQPVKITSISLGAGNSSNFRLNVDGVPVKRLTDVEIAANDSVFVFVEVTVNPTNQNSPLIILDSVMFETNGNMQHVMLEAWGQDAYYHRPDVFPASGFPAYSVIAKKNESIVWNNDKPHVIYGYAVVDSAGMLTINAGAKIHFHKNAGMWVYRFGTLKVLGVQGNPVTFQGDRLELDYRDVPGQWDRIWINQGSVDNEINYAIIRNGFIGLQAERFLVLDGTNKLKLNNTIIENMSGMGIYTVNYYIQGANNRISNCGKYALAVTLGGGYRFDHCTFANYWSEETRTTPAILITNRNEAQALPLDSAYFNNCLLYGDLANELEVDSGGGVAFNYRIYKSIIKTTLNTSNTFHFSNVANGSDPQFKDVSKQDYHLNPGSPAINAGDPNIAAAFPFDLDGEARPQGAGPDMGCYEDY